MDIPLIAHVATLTLKHPGDCSLLGVSPDETIYAEEVYGENAWVAQHALTSGSTLIESVDEAEGTQEIQPLDLPDGTILSKSGWQTMALNFAGPRHRGLREPERIGDLVRPLDIQEKMALARRLRLDLPPPALLGLAESYVLAETRITPPNLYFVCRRLRLAIALPQAKLDADGQPYDYETRVLYLAHFYDGSEIPFGKLFENLTDVPLHRPMDCLLVGSKLYIADGGDSERLSTIHIWQLDLPAVPSREEQLMKKIYG
ncbi:MAG TPA: hypothetical protein VHD90_09875 [Phototrophicaceae bacterium]|nr:hypothetical protein [Phototrophicaceae bacterium]